MLKKIPYLRNNVRNTTYRQIESFYMQISDKIDNSDIYFYL